MINPKLCVAMRAAIATTLAISLSSSVTTARAHSKHNQNSAGLPVFEEKVPGSLVKFEMIKIPAGSIELNDPAKPGQKATVKVNSLWIGKTEVIWELYDIYAFRLDLTDEQKAKNFDAESRPSKPYGAPDRGFGHDGFAALSMTHNSATKFCEWLSKMTGHKYRLATEAEWEYAARAGKPAGAPLTKAELEEVAWYWENADDATHKVATKKANAWGLFDMLGNAAEWTTGIDGKPITCGGSFLDKVDKVQASGREGYVPKWQQDDAHTPKSKWWLSNATHVGFRIVSDELPK